MVNGKQEDAHLGALRPPRPTETVHLWGIVQCDKCGIVLSDGTGEPQTNHTLKRFQFLLSQCLLLNILQKQNLKLQLRA